MSHWNDAIALCSNLSMQRHVFFCLNELLLLVKSHILLFLFVATVLCGHCFLIFVLSRENCFHFYSNPVSRRNIIKRLFQCFRLRITQRYELTANTGIYRGGGPAGGGWVGGLSIKHVDAWVSVSDLMWHQTQRRGRFIHSVVTAAGHCIASEWRERERERKWLCYHLPFHTW